MLGKSDPPRRTGICPAALTWEMGLYVRNTKGKTSTAVGARQREPAVAQARSILLKNTESYTIFKESILSGGPVLVSTGGSIWVSAEGLGISVQTAPERGTWRIGSSSCTARRGVRIAWPGCVTRAKEQGYLRGMGRPSGSGRVDTPAWSGATCRGTKPARLGTVRDVRRQEPCRAGALPWRLRPSRRRSRRP